MKKIIILTFLFFIGIEKIYSDDQCFTCHQTIEDNAGKLYSKDIHYLKGFSCTVCHGGNKNSDDADLAMNPKNGFKGIPKGDQISIVCASCHSDDAKMKNYGSKIPTNQFEKLNTSVHSKNSISGKDKILQCTTCHSVHNIVSVKNRTSPVYPLNVVNTCSNCHSSASYMRNYNPSLAVDQHEKYKTSKHGILNSNGDAKTAECASCHGSHEILSSKDLKSQVNALNLPATCSKCHSDAEYMKKYKIPTDQFEKFSGSIHGKTLLFKKDMSAPACNDCHGNHGAAPPGVESISKVCGSCHALNAELFSASPHKTIFDKRKLPECETCHGNHKIEVATNKLLGVTEEAICSKCHSENENKKGFKVASLMRILIDSLEISQTNAKKLIFEAEQKGMEISDAKFKLREAHQARLQSRTAVHSFSEKDFREVVDKGILVSNFVTLEAEKSIGEFYFRRWGLGVSTLIITIVTIALWLTIKKIELKQKIKKKY